VYYLYGDEQYKIQRVNTALHANRM